MDTAAMPMDEWRTLPWKKYERQVFRLQKRIYRASSRDDEKTVHNLQKLLTKSWSAKCLAVRRVTQDNQGKKTAGVDGVKSLAPIARPVGCNAPSLNVYATTSAPGLSPPMAALSSMSWKAWASSRK